MTDNLKVKASKAVDDARVAAHAVYDDAKVAAHNTLKDAGVKAQDVSGDVKKGDRKPVSGDSKVEPHNMDSEVTTSIRQEKLICPQCGKSTIRAEFPDQYEAWIKGSECGFFMGMSNADWHRMDCIIPHSRHIHESMKKTQTVIFAFGWHLAESSIDKHPQTITNTGPI